jgi:hypothetical protein
VSPVFDSPRDLEDCSISRAPAPSDAFATPPDNNINICFLLQPRLWVCHCVLTRRVCVTDCVIIVSIWVSSLSNCKMTQLDISSGLMSPADLNKLLLELLK